MSEPIMVAALARKLRAVSLLALLASSGCERAQPPAKPTPPPARQVTTSHAANAPTLSRPDAGRPTTSFDHGGYRHQYTPRASPTPIALVVIGSTDELWKARRLARRARTKLGLSYEDFAYVAGFGFTQSRAGCTEMGYPCAAPSRGGFEGSHAYLSIEHSGGYENLDSKQFVVIAAHGAPDSDLLSTTLAKARAVFPDAYQKATRVIWLEHSATKLGDETPPVR